MELTLSKIPVAEAGMLVHKSAEQVYEAFVDPEITTKFWFTKSTGRLEAGKRLRWDWEMYAASTQVEGLVLEPGRRILLTWSLESQPTTVEWIFTPLGSTATFVSITNSGFSGSGDEVVAQVKGSEAGFALVLAGLKAYLEHGIKLNLIADRFPDRLINQPKMGIEK